MTLYRDHRFGLDERHLHLAALENGPELVHFEEPSLAVTQG
jgi:hypothetical protein